MYTLYAHRIKNFTEVTVDFLCIQHASKNATSQCVVQTIALHIVFHCIVAHLLHIDAK